MAVAQTLSTIATDKLRNFRFGVVLRPHTGGAINMGFMSVSGLSMNVDVIPYREGGFNTTTQKLPGQADFNPVTLSHGIAVGSSQPDLEWVKMLFSVVQGTGSPTAGQDFRYTCDIMVYAHPAQITNPPVKAQFRLYNTWPTAIAWADLDAGANQLFVSQLSLAHEGFDLHMASGSGNDNAPGFSF